MHGLPHDWAEQVIRAYTVFGIDPASEYGVADLLRGARRYWTPAKRRIKAVEQLRAPKGHDDAGRWIPGPRTTLPGPEARGRVDDGVDAWTPSPQDRGLDLADALNRYQEEAGEGVRWDAVPKPLTEGAGEQTDITVSQTEDDPIDDNWQGRESGYQLGKMTVKWDQDDATIISNGFESGTDEQFEILFRAVMEQIGDDGPVYADTVESDPWDERAGLSGELLLSQGFDLDYRYGLPVQPSDLRSAYEDWKHDAREDGVRHRDAPYSPMTVKGIGEQFERLMDRLIAGDQSVSMRDFQALGRGADRNVLGDALVDVEWHAAREPYPELSTPPAPTEAPPVKHTVTQEQFDAAVASLVHEGGLPRANPMSDDPELVAALLTEWVRTSKAFDLAPGVGVGSNVGGWREESLQVPGRDDLVSVARNAKRLVAQNLSDATAGTISTEALRGLAARTDTDGLRLEWMHNGYRIKGHDDPASIPGVQGWVRRMDKPGILYAFRDGAASEGLNDQEGYDYAPAGTPEADTMFRDYYMGRLVSTWAKTSNDHHPLALAIQEAAKGILPEGSAPTDAEMPDEVRSQMETILAENGADLVAFLAAQQQATRDLLAALDVASLRLYRGQSTTPERLAKAVAPEDLDVASETWGERNKGLSRPFQASTAQRPISSWATDASVAQEFASSLGTGVIRPGAFSYLFAAEVPAEEILSTTLTGFGAFNEAEMVTLSAIRSAVAVRSAGPSVWPKYLDAEDLAMLLRNPARLGVPRKP